MELFMFLALGAFCVLIISVALHDRCQRKEPHKRVYPLVWRVQKRRFTKDAESVVPFSKGEAHRIRRVAVTGEFLSSFGADLIETSRYPLIRTRLLGFAIESRLRPITIGMGNVDINTVSAPVLNFGALGFGPVSANTLAAVGRTARVVRCLANTGEDGLTDVHLSQNCDLIWQIGTGYWGCRDVSGRFHDASFRTNAAHPNVRMVEIKLSQGAKPGHGGLLPAAKNTRYVANILGVQPHTNIISPPNHTAFSTLNEMLHFLSHLRDLAGKPVGIKTALGSLAAIDELCEAMASTGQVPDFLTIDGGDGGTGAAFPAVQNHTGLPVVHTIPLLHQALVDMGVRNRVTIFAAGRISNGYDLFRLMCLGADACFFTRAPLIAMGCVQARECHTGKCPSGIATNDPWRRSAVSPTRQSLQLRTYYESVIAECEALLVSAACMSQDELDQSFLIEDPTKI